MRAVRRSRAQAAGPGFALSDGAAVSLVTVAPGGDVYNRFGHTGVRVFDPASGLDVLYNYGTFRFDGLFVFRFAYGALDYELSVQEYPRAVAFYRDVEGRTTVEQRLDLDARQRQALFEALETNARPENATYRYDFLFDNCSTRPRDVLERVLGPALRYRPAAYRPATFRAILAPYVRPAPLLHTGIDLALGLPVDRRATQRETTFLPDYLFALLNRAEVQTPGGWRPLVARVDTVVYAPARRAAFPWPGWALAALFAAGAGMTLRDVVRRRPSRHVWMDRALFGAAGLAGCVLAFLWLVSLHDVTGPNLHVLWAWPTHLAFAFVLRRRTRAVRRYALAAAVVSGATALAWFALPQALPVAVLPLVLLLAVRALALWWRGEAA